MMKKFRMPYIEKPASWLLGDRRVSESEAFTKGCAFASLNEPTVLVTSPDFGENGATLGTEYIRHAETPQMPALNWEVVGNAADDVESKAKEWLVIVEDMDTGGFKPMYLTQVQKEFTDG